jgi:hypothetical protein
MTPSPNKAVLAILVSIGCVACKHTNRSERAQSQIESIQAPILNGKSYVPQQFYESVCDYENSTPSAKGVPCFSSISFGETSARLKVGDEFLDARYKVLGKEIALEFETTAEWANQFRIQTDSRGNLLRLPDGQEFIPQGSMQNQIMNPHPGE